MTKETLEKAKKLDSRIEKLTKFAMCFSNKFSYIDISYKECGRSIATITLDDKDKDDLENIIRFRLETLRKEFENLK